MVTVNCAGPSSSHRQQTIYYRVFTSSSKFCSAIQETPSLLTSPSMRTINFTLLAVLSCFTAMIGAIPIKNSGLFRSIARHQEDHNQNPADQDREELKSCTVNLREILDVDVCRSRASPADK